jgi:hypothetical protein
MDMAAPRKKVRLTGTLADIAHIRKKPTVLLGPISEYLITQNAKPSGRRQDIIHPSEMAAGDWCPRQTFYRIRDVRAGKPYTPEKFSVATLAIFDEGHSIHAKWQRRLADMGLLWGQWKCLCCGDVVNGIEPNPRGCIRCGGEALEYAEVPMDAEDDYMIVGHADGYVPEHRCLIEIKSVGMGTLRMDVPELLREHTVTTPDGRKIYDVDEIWRNLDEPLAPHVRQANVYLHIAASMGLDADRMVFLYEYKSNQQVREFVIHKDLDVLQPLLDSAAHIRHAIEFDVPPPARELAQDSAKCKKCPHFTECWSADATDPAPEPTPRQDAGRGYPRSNDGAGGRRPATPRTSGRTDAPAPGRRHRTVRRRADAAVPPDGGVDPVRE